MHVISVQSIAGGTGVTSVTAELIADKSYADETILAIDFGANQMLGRAILGRGFENLADASKVLTGGWAEKWLKLGGLPRRCLLDLRAQQSRYDRCREQFALEAAKASSLDGLVDSLRGELALLGAHFDNCIVDLSQAPGELRRLFIAVSDEVHFCERLTSQHQTWEAFREEFLDGVKAKPGQAWIKHQDRSDWRPKVIEDCPAMLLAEA